MEIADHRAPCPDKPKFDSGLSHIEMLSQDEILSCKPELEKMGLGKLVKFVWVLKSTTLVEEIIQYNRGSKPSESHRSDYDQWTVRTLAEVYGLPDKGLLLTGRDYKSLCKDYFAAPPARSDGWDPAECIDVNLRSVLRFLIPILTPEKNRVTGKLAATVVRAWARRESVNWAAIFHEKFSHMARRAQFGKPNYLSPWLYHIYSHHNLLSADEKSEYDQYELEYAMGILEGDKEVKSENVEEFTWEQSAPVKLLTYKSSGGRVPASPSVTYSRRTVNEFEEQGDHVLSVLSSFVERFKPVFASAKQIERDLKCSLLEVPQAFRTAEEQGEEAKDTIKRLRKELQMTEDYITNLERKLTNVSQKLSIKDKARTARHERELTILKQKMSIVEKERDILHQRELGNLNEKMAVVKERDALHERVRQLKEMVNYNPESSFSDMKQSISDLLKFADNMAVAREQQMKLVVYDSIRSVDPAEQSSNLVANSMGGVKRKLDEQIQVSQNMPLQAQSPIDEAQPTTLHAGETFLDGKDGSSDTQQGGEGDECEAQRESTIAEKKPKLELHS